MKSYSVLAKKLEAILTAVALLAVLTSSAHALTFTLSSATVAFGDNNVPTAFPNDATAVQTATGVMPLTRLYRTDGAGPGNESGLAQFLTGYRVEFADGNSDISLIDDGDTNISGYARLFLVTRANDGSAANPDWKIFDVTGWNGTETITLDSVFSNPSNPSLKMVIAEINIYGGGTATSTVPDGGATILLLGTALVGLTSLSRRKPVLVG